MAGGSVERDLAYMLFRSSSTGELRDRLYTILGEDFFKTAKQYNIKLKYAKNSIENFYNELRNLLEGIYFDSNGIMDQLMQICQTNGTLEFREELTKNLIDNLDLSTQNTYNLEEKIWNLFYSYEETFDLMIESQELLEGIGEQIRGDKALFAFGQEYEKQLSKISLITKEGYSEFQRNNRDLFGLTFNQNKAGKFTLGQLTPNAKQIYNDKVREGLSKITSKFIIEDILDVKINSALTYRQVWDELQQAKIFTDAYVKNNYQDYRNNKKVQKYISDARKQEILLSGAFSTASTIDEVKAIIQNNYYSFDTGENVSGFATGDSNLALHLQDKTQYFAIQSKLSNGYYGWNGVAMNSLIEAFNFYGDEKKMFDIIDNNIDRANFGQINTYFQEVYGKSYDDMGYRMGEYVYQDMYYDESSGNYMFQEDIPLEINA